MVVCDASWLTTDHHKPTGGSWFGFGSVEGGARLLLSHCCGCTTTTLSKVAGVAPGREAGPLPLKMEFLPKQNEAASGKQFGAFFIPAKCVARTEPRTSPVPVRPPGFVVRFMPISSGDPLKSVGI